MGVYDDLLRFKLGLLDRVRRELPKLLPVAQKAAADDNTIIERQMEGYQLRLDLRFALPNTRIMMHQPSGAFEGQATDIEIHAQEVLFLKGRINEILAKTTGQDIERIGVDSDRNHWMRPEEAREYGLIDDIIQRHEKPEEIQEIVQTKLKRDPKLDTNTGEKAAETAKAW